MIVETLEAEEVADKIDEVVRDKAAGGVEEPIVELSVEAILDRAAEGVGAITD